MVTLESVIARMTNILGNKSTTEGQKRDIMQEVFESILPLSLKVSTPAADSAADMDAGVILLGSSIDVTAVTPKRPGQILILWCTASGTDPSATCGAGVTINAAGNNKMVFPDADDAMILVAASLTRWNIILNIGSVTLSTV